MKIKFPLLLAGLLGFASSLHAQDGNDQIQAGIQYAIPNGDFSKIASNGYGAFVKGMYGVGEKANQLTLELGFNSFDTNIKHKTGSNQIIPLMLGYRINLNHFVLEPQAGLSLNALVEDTGKSTKAKFGWATIVGYNLKNVELGVKYQATKFNSESKDLSFIGLRLAYNFSL